MENSTIDTPNGNNYFDCSVATFMFNGFMLQTFRFIKLMFSSLRQVDQFQDAVLSWNGLVTDSKGHLFTELPFQEQRHLRIIVTCVTTLKQLVCLSPV